MVQPVHVTLQVVGVKNIHHLSTPCRWYWSFDWTEMPCRSVMMRSHHPQKIGSLSYLPTSDLHMTAAYLAGMDFSANFYVWGHTGLTDHAQHYGI